jgi:Phospholipase B
MRFIRNHGLTMALLGALAFGAASLCDRAPGEESRGLAAEAPAGAPAKPVDARLKGAYRFERAGWIYVHLQGTPEEIGYQHGYLLAPEIKDAFEVVKLEDTHSSQRGWDFFRKAAREMLWPKISAEYQQELKGIVEGLKARGVPMDLDDVVALNAFEELPDYYVPWYNSQHNVAEAPHLVSPGNCSAFIATGSWTKDGKIVMAHNAWTGYLEGERWRIIFDIVPTRGHRILMDGFPGVITSDDDFGVNSAGIMVTETTITQFEGWNPDGIPEFERSRKAMQYANSIDDYVRIMVTGNNGGYANDWLIGDRKTGEIAQLELGLKNHRVWRTKDGYFAGSNWARDPKVLAQETTFDSHNPASSPNARRVRWDELMKEYKRRIDVALAEKFLGDHYDAYLKKEIADERTLCGHVDATARGVPEWEWGPYYPGGAVQGKATDSAMAKAMSFVARMGHPGGENFYVKPFLAAHHEYDWQAPLLRDMIAGPWATFKAGQSEK